MEDYVIELLTNIKAQYEAHNINAIADQGEQISETPKGGKQDFFQMMPA